MIGERIRKARIERGLMQIDLAVAMGDRYGSSMISQLESGQRSLRLEGAALAARELGVSLDYLVGLTDDSTPSTQLESRLAKAEAELDAYRNELGQPAQRQTASLQDDDAAVWMNGDAIPADARPVAVREIVEASGGYGTYPGDEDVTNYAWFRQGWLKQHNINPDRADVIKVAGDSMEPTLPEGSSILVDRQRRSRRKGRIYVLQTEDGLMVKRAGREKAGWQLLSDNPYWPSVAWPEDAQVVGEVRWSAVTH